MTSVEGIRVIAQVLSGAAEKWEQGELSTEECQAYLRECQFALEAIRDNMHDPMPADLICGLIHHHARSGPGSRRGRQRVCLKSRPP